MNCRIGHAPADESIANWYKLHNGPADRLLWQESEPALKSCKQAFCTCSPCLAAKLAILMPCPAAMLPAIWDARMILDEASHMDDLSEVEGLSWQSVVVLSAGMPSHLTVVWHTWQTMYNMLKQAAHQHGYVSTRSAYQSAFKCRKAYLKR